MSSLHINHCSKAPAYPGPDVEFDVGVSDATLDAKQLLVRQDSVPAQDVPQMLNRVQIGSMGRPWNCGNSVLM